MNNINILRCSFLALVGITGILANLEEKIITKNTSLQCFEKPMLVKGASISYEWTFTGGFPTLTDQDIKDYPEEYSRGKDTGDINLLNFQNETKTNATCKPVVDGNLVPGKSYQILPFRPITNVSIKCDSDTVYGKPGNYYCTCKSLGGSPTPRLSFLLENINKSSEISDTIKFPIPLNCSDSLKLLKCIASQRYRQPEDLNDAFRFNITCPPYRSIHGPVTPKLPEEGSSFMLTICFRSNPKHFNSTWFYADNCCISMGDCDLKYSEPRYDLQQPKKVSEDSDEYCAVLNIDKVEKEDFGRHFFLYVTNSEGLAKFSHTIDKLKAEDGVNTTILAFLIIFVLLFLAMVAVALFLWKKGARSSPDGYSTTNDDHMMDPK